eukprot:scaffold15507_cov80-Skeletonema_dohrnii-CCMP3373.AAC.1
MGSHQCSKTARTARLFNLRLTRSSDSQDKLFNMHLLIKTVSKFASINLNILVRRRITVRFLSQGESSNAILQ